MPIMYPGAAQPAADVRRVGIPRALLYYRFGTLWRTFFEELDRDVVVDGPTDRGTFESGEAISVDEACLASKVYMGHVRALMATDPAPDAIFVPSIGDMGRYHSFCTKFQSLPDLVENSLTLYDTCPRIITCCVEELEQGLREEDAYLGLAAELGASRKQAKTAWKAACRAQAEHDSILARAQENLISSVRKAPADARPLTILVAAHPYVAHDSFIGGPVKDALDELGCTVLFADESDRERSYKKSFEFSRTMPWQVNRELVGSILNLHDFVDGIVVMSAFPCGPDSMTDDAITRCIKGKPVLTLTIDAQSGTAGLETRIESFVDILRYQKKGGYLHDERSAS